MNDKDGFWLARNKDGKLSLFNYKPIKNEDNDEWTIQSWWTRSMEIYDYLYKEVTWENSPIKVELKLKERNG